MKLLFPEPYIDIGKVGFDKNCVLGRAASGKKLSELVDKIDDPIVIAVDGPWGSGKSHFLKLWTGAHKLENEGKAEVIYFDAFKHDYFDDPLTALVGEISKYFDAEPDEDESDALQTLKKWGGWLGRFKKPVVRASLALATAGGTEVVGAIGDALINVASAEAAKAIDNFWQNETTRRDAMEGFRPALTALTIEKGSEETPQKIVIIIDELDRCRPDFALDMLEIIKHFFSVENVIFVLGVNLSELENSVKARYGGGVDAERYLQKFVTLRFQLPSLLGAHEKANTWEVYYKIAVRELAIPDYLANHAITYIKSLPESSKISIREIQRFLSVLALVPTSQEGGVTDKHFWGWKASIVGMAVMKVFCPKLYESARNMTLSYRDLTDVFQFFNATNTLFNKYERRVWAEIFGELTVQKADGIEKSPFGPFGLRRSDDFLLQISDDFLETFEIVEPT